MYKNTYLKKKNELFYNSPSTTVHEIPTERIQVPELCININERVQLTWEKPTLSEFRNIRQHVGPSVQTFTTGPLSCLLPAHQTPSPPLLRYFLRLTEGSTQRHIYHATIKITA